MVFKVQDTTMAETSGKACDPTLVNPISFAMRVSPPTLKAFRVEVRPDRWTVELPITRFQDVPRDIGVRKAWIGALPNLRRESPQQEGPFELAQCSLPAMTVSGGDF